MRILVHSSLTLNPFNIHQVDRAHFSPEVPAVVTQFQSPLDCFVSSGNDDLGGSSSVLPDEAVIKRMEAILLKCLGPRSARGGRHFIDGIPEMRGALIAIERHMSDASLKDIKEMLGFVKDLGPSRTGDSLGFNCLSDHRYPVSLSQEFTTLKLSIVDKLLDHKDEVAGYQTVGNDQTAYAMLYDQVANKRIQRTHYDRERDKPYLGDHSPEEYANRVMIATLADTKRALELRLAK